MRRVKDRLISSPSLDNAAERFFTLGMVLLNAFFVYQFGSNYLATRRFSSLMAVVVSSLSVVVFLARHRPEKVTVDPYAWLAALAGTWLPLLLRVTPGAEILVGQVLQVSGFVIQVAALLSLNRSMGVVAANRGVKTSGPYRFVRHPLYTAYFVSFTGLLINHRSAYNLTVLGFWAFFQWVRIRYEEEILSLDPRYREYKQRTRWRIVPLLY